LRYRQVRLLLFEVEVSRSERTAVRRLRSQRSALGRLTGSGRMASAHDDDLPVVNGAVHQ